MSETNLSTRPIYVGAVASTLDRFYMGEQSINKNIMFGASVAVGTAVGEVLTNKLPKMPTLDKNMYNGKTLTERIAEVGASAGIAYGVNKYVIGNDSTSGLTQKRIGVIVASDVIGTYAYEYMQGQPLEFLE